MTLTQRFLKYVAFDTQSDENSNTIPSTKKQLVLANELLNELKQMNIENAYIDEYGIVYAFIDANDHSNKKIGLIAHMDTSPDMSGKNVKPQIIKNYDGSTILLNKKLNLSMDSTLFPSLKECIGDDLITTDGTTLLGADDKAGIAIIMSFLEYVMANPNYLHCKICVAFTPDEEIGKGADHFNISKFDANFAYTIDGGAIYEINYENFNAASAKVMVKGNSIHPGSAKNKMLNSILIANEFNDLLPSEAIPSKTEGYEGFNHICDISGNCEETIMHYILRNHDLNLLQQQKNDFYKAMKTMNDIYPSKPISIQIQDSYFNMKELVLKNPDVLNTIYSAYQKLNIPYETTPIRGGTDGARLTFDGLPTPNLGTGGYNCHGKYEYVSINQMEKMVEIIKEIFH